MVQEQIWGYRSISRWCRGVVKMRDLHEQAWLPSGLLSRSSFDQLRLYSSTWTWTMRQFPNCSAWLEKVKLRPQRPNGLVPSIASEIIACCENDIANKYEFIDHVGYFTLSLDDAVYFYIASSNLLWRLDSLPLCRRIFSWYHTISFLFAL